ncbi:mucin-like protein [Actinidia rufa]|uniref:Mucin-like protein n=1 Tax=Actinidia rufa TaxID=165716 RepID=A0A7J0FN54_9ERIC|nr:mucin-like protein [Actinidia rufa]
MHRFSHIILKTLLSPRATHLRPLSTANTADDEWNDAWESAWLPESLSGKNRAPWETDVNFPAADNPPSEAVVLPSDADAEAETKAFVEDMTENWDQRRKGSNTMEKREGNSLYSLQSIKRDYRLKKQRIHAGLWVKEIERQEEDKLGDSIGGGGDDIERLLDSCSETLAPPSKPPTSPSPSSVASLSSFSTAPRRALHSLTNPFPSARARCRAAASRPAGHSNSDMDIVILPSKHSLFNTFNKCRIFDSANNDLNDSKIPSASEFKNKPDGWETTTKAQDGSVWEMSQREEDILLQEYERRIAFSKFQIASFIKTHIFSRRRPIDGWKYMIEEIGPNAKRGKGSVSRLPSLSDASTQPFKEEKTPIASTVNAYKRR